MVIQINSDMQNPTAKIAVNKNLVKLYENEKIFLNNGQHFQIELYNPLSTEVLAIIKVNNENIGAGGIILRPLERVFLERFLDKPKKFQFNVYTASGTEEQIGKVIKDNGTVEILFFKKEEVINLSTPVYDWGKSYLTTNGNLNFFTNPITDISMNRHESFSTADFYSVNNTANTEYISKETGRINEGKNSNQQFEYLNMCFSNEVLSKVFYKLLPTSEFHHTSESSYKTRIYCDMCGSRIRKNTSKFCRNCGSKL